MSEIFPGRKRNRQLTRILTLVFDLLFFAIFVVTERKSELVDVAKQTKAHTHKDGQAIIEACKSGAVEILAMLLAGDSKVAEKTLQRGFQAATQVGDLKRRAEIFKLLLQMGVTGEVVDAQLGSLGAMPTISYDPAPSPPLPLKP